MTLGPMTLLEAAGWAGTLIYVAVYGLLAVGTIAAGRLYFGLNLAAAVGVAAVSWEKGTWQAVVLNVLWGAVSLYGLRGVSPPVAWVPVGVARGAVAALLATGGVAFALGSPGWGAELWGWASVLAYLLGYALFVARRIPERELHAWNLLAALALLLELWLDGNAPVFALQVAWGLAALAGLWRTGRSGRGRR